MRLLTLICLLLPLTAMAYPVGTSIGWGTGYSWTEATFDEPIDDFGGQVEVPSYSEIRNQDLPWNMYAGFRFHQHYGIELGYLDYGSIKFKKTLTSTTSTGEFNGSVVRDARISTQGLYINHVIYFQLLDKLQLQAKAGILFGSNDYAETGSHTIVNEDGTTSTPADDFNSSSESFAKAQLAVGLLYQYQSDWRLRLQLNQIEFDHSNEKESFSQWFTSFSIERRL